MVDFTCEGPLGDCWVKNGVGQVRVEQAEKLSVKSGAGDIEVGRVAGDAELATGSGDVRATSAGQPVVKNSNGGTWVGVAVPTCGSTRPTAASRSRGARRRSRRGRQR